MDLTNALGSVASHPGPWGGAWNDGPLFPFLLFPLFWLLVLGWLVTLAASGAPSIDVFGLLSPPIVSLTAPSDATVLSVYPHTPCGLVRRGRLTRRRSGGRPPRRPTVARPRA